MQCAGACIFVFLHSSYCYFYDLQETVKMRFTQEVNFIDFQVGLHLQM